MAKDIEKMNELVHNLRREIEHQKQHNHNAE